MEDYFVEHGKDPTYRCAHKKHILKNKNKEIGYAISRKHKGSNAVSLSELYIKDDFQGKGLSKILIEDVKNTYPNENLILRANPYKNKSMNKSQLENMYKKHGFKNTKDGCMIFERSADMDKLAYYKEQIHKQAMEKQAKGWLRNTAINVAQDFVSAGNPLNPSSHIFGSVSDGVLMEGLDRKMRKEEAKLKNQQAQQEKKNNNNVL